MPNRIIKETIKRSPEIDSLSWFEEVVFYRIIVTADDYGCLDGRMILLKNELFPTKETVTKKAVADAVEKLASVGLLCKYTVNGMPYLFLPTWERHQRIRNKHRKYPEPPADVLESFDRHLTANCQPESESESESESELESPPSPPPKKQTEKKVQWAEFVTMTNEEHQKLLDAYGPADTARLIEILDDYKGSSGKRYKSDYRAIRAWCVDRLNEEKRRPGAKPEYKPEANNVPSRAKQNAEWMRRMLDAEEAENDE